MVKTYPNLSRKYVETVCVGGLTDNGKWIRIFPIRFRQLPFNKRFSKFDIIEAEVEPTHDKFGRIENHTIKDTTIEILGKLPATPENWERRKKLVLSHLDKSLEELELKKESDHVTMGIIKPREIIDFYRKNIEEFREWEAELIQGNQKTLIEKITGKKYESPLEKIPYWMGYHFYCQDERCNGHNMMCEDWEMLELFRNMRKREGSDEKAFEKVKQSYFTWMKERDIYFVVGTESKWNNFLIIGIFYPPK
ncbi:MAG: hypothetical protein ACREBF_01185 [Candidatus Micrarchaeales archaeon]